MARLSLLAFLLALGCSGGPKSHHVKGIVKYNGEPVKRGIIRFEPDSRTGTDGPEGFAYITDGQYDTRLDNGRAITTGGGYIVRIDGFDGKPGAELPMGKPVFTNHSETRNFDAADQEQNFDVPKKKAE